MTAAQFDVVLQYLNDFYDLDVMLVGLVLFAVVLLGFLAAYMVGRR